MMLSKSIGTNIKQLRTEKGLSQEDLASILFVTRQTISNYETGRSYPDIDTLEQISKALDVELSWLLYGKPVPKDQKAKKTAAWILLGIFSALLILTAVLRVYAGTLAQTTLNVMPNTLVRLILVPITMTVFGSTVLQIIDCFVGLGQPKKHLRKIGRISTVCVVGTNLIFVLPYLVWCFWCLIQHYLGPGSVSMVFPRISVYQEVAWFFLALMLKYPFMYIFVGMALWLFWFRKSPQDNCTLS